MLLWGCCALAAPKDYKNFDLPEVPKIVPSSPYVSFKSDKLSFRGKVSVKEPGVSRRQFFFAKEAFLTEKRDQAIKLLRQQMDQGYKQNRDNMLLRLGQLYTEKYMELGYRESELYQEKVRQYEKLTETRKKTVAPTLDNQRSQQYLKLALDVFTRLEKEYPKHKQLDEVLFFIGFVHLEYGNGPKGSMYLERVVKGYPRSRKYEEAVLYLGDYYFEKKQYKIAVAKFQILRRKRDSPLLHYALYKLAWCELNTGESKRALSDMKAVVELLSDNSDTAKFNLKEQALKDLVIFFAEVERVDEAIAYFTRAQGKEKAFENLKLLADILASKAKDEAALLAYTRLLSEFGDYEDAPRWQLAVYDILARRGKTEKAVRHLLQSLERYGSGSGWAESHKEKEETTTTLEVLRSEALKAAFFYHHAAQKSLQKGYYQYALDLYRALLKSFPELPDRRKLVFYQGEILYNQGKWLEAANVYMGIAENPPKDKLAEDCAYNALLSLDRLTAKSDKVKRYTKEEQKTLSLEPQSIPTEEKRFIEVAEFYIREYPQASRVVDVEFRIASTYYRTHHFDEALERFKKLALSHPRHRSATTAAHIALDIYNIKKDYTRLDGLAALFAGTGDLGDARFKGELAQIRGELGFKSIEALEKENRWKEAADSYLSFYRANPASPLAEKSLYNAVASIERSSEKALLIEMSKLFISKYPNHDYSKRLLLNLARMAQQNYDYEEAQKWFLQFYKKYPTDRESKKALYNAAVFAEILEMDKTALTLYEDILKQKGISEEERKSILISEVKIHKKSGNAEKVAALYKELVKRATSLEEKVGFLGEGFKFYERRGTGQAKAWLVEISGMVQHQPGAIKITGPAQLFVAQAKFSALSLEREKYEKVRLQFPPEVLVRDMKKKQKMLTDLAEKYDRIVEIGVPEVGVAALLQKSEAYDHFVRIFRKVPLPKRYKGGESEKELKEIDETVVKPLENRVQEILRVCANKAAQFHVVGSYAAKCRERSSDSSSKLAPSGIIPEPALWSRVQDVSEDAPEDAPEAAKVQESPPAGNLELLLPLMGGKQSKETETQLKEFLKQNPTDKRGLFLLGAYYLKNGKRGLAKYLLDPLEKDSGFAWRSLLLNDLGLMALQEGNRTLALGYFERASRSLPEVWEPLVNLGAMYLQSHSYADAEAVFRKARLMEEDSEEAVLGLGSALEGLGKFEDAHQVYNDYTSSHPNTLSALYNDAVLIGGRLGRHEEASQKLLRYIQRGGKETARAQEIVKTWR